MGSGSDSGSDRGSDSGSDGDSDSDSDSDKRDRGFLTFYVQKNIKVEVLAKKIGEVFEKPGQLQLRRVENTDFLHLLPYDKTLKELKIPSKSKLEIVENKCIITDNE